MGGFSSSAMTMAERVTWYCALFMAVMLVLCCCEMGGQNEPYCGMAMTMHQQQRETADKPCDEIYVVREGETLQTIGEKCSDPYIVEENPHIHDPDNVFPGLVIKITPFHS